MTVEYRTKLATIRRFDQLIAFLRDEMGWPIVSDDFEEMTFEYSAGELGIDDVNAAKIQEIRRLRPLAVNQPWGVFFVKFEPKRLPVVALRSILGRVAQKKRASANSADRPAWAMDDLLFISNYGEGETRQISFAHFAAPASTSKLPTLKVVAWDDRDTALHLDQVARELTQGLAWPADEENAGAWRHQWRAAFTLGYRETITTAQQLSISLAKLAKVTRDRIQGALVIENEKGRITQLRKSFRETLVHDLDVADFADMVAQTVAYGLLSARIADPERAATSDLATHMRTNPLLRDLMTTFLEVSGQQHANEMDFDELGVAEVVELLDNANMDAVIRDFGDKKPREDPVIHFYESFLSEYDKQKKVERGVFYTPRPVVSYIVRSVDQLLRTKLGLADGLADVTTWGEMAKRHKSLMVPDDTSPNQDFVQVLDPATGTGTFLVEVIDLIHSTLVDKWKAKGYRADHIVALWNEYVPKHLLSRLHGYELLMAPYAIAHLKIGLKLYETGYRFGSHERAKVYLTNALEPAHTVSGLMNFAIPALAAEAKAVNKVKHGQRFTVVIGNPPYLGHSTNKGDWIRGLLRGKDDTRLVESYFYVDGSPLKERNLKWLSDDYVKFLRLAHFQIERAGEGVVGFITNHSYLDNPTFRGMRESFYRTFGTSHLLDLHGNSKKKERTPQGGMDENVFEIQQGVAISLFASCLHRDQTPTRVLHGDLWGARDTDQSRGKYRWLGTNDVRTTEWKELSPKSPLYLFVPRDETFFEEYDAGWSIADVFPIGSTGIVSKRDRIAYHFDKDGLYRTLNDFATLPEEHLREKYRFRESRDGKIGFVKDHILGYGIKEEYICPCLYRPFDQRWTYHTDKSKGFLGWPVYDVMRHMSAGPNLGMISVRQVAEGIFNHVFVSSKIADFRTMLSNKGGAYLFPLYTYPPESLSQVSASREPNFDRRFIDAFSSAVRLSFIRDGAGDLDMTFGPQQVFHYIYAVLHSPSYRCRYADFLKSDYPQVPLPSARPLFVDLIGAGAELANLHLMECEGSRSHVSFIGAGSNRVDRLRYAQPSNGFTGRVWINREQYFEGIEPSIWDFAIAGYRPSERWLKDRKGRVLSDDDINHYRRIVAALADTKHLMDKIDDLIGQHGGWPEAFQ